MYLSAKSFTWSDLEWLESSYNNVLLLNLWFQNLELEYLEMYGFGIYV